MQHIKNTPLHPQRNPVLGLQPRHYAKTKKFTQIMAVLILSVPTQSLNSMPSQPNPTSAYDNVMASGYLTIASVEGNSTFFSTDGFNHGFGYDLARAYAQNLGVSIEIKRYPNDAAALSAVQANQADMALTTASTYQTEALSLAAMPVSCGFDTHLIKNGLHSKTNWSFKHKEDTLATRASDFLCDDKQRVSTANMADFYSQSLLQDDYNRWHFKKALDENLPTYKASFQKHADNHDLDWQLLVAMGYQESQLEADAVSPTGVKGLMMLTHNTAEAMGVANRVDPYQSIRGGARYLDEMQDMFLDIPNPDRLWFSLASYNMGPYAIKKIQTQIKAEGRNPNRWTNIYAYMADNADNNSRYGQCIHYVTSIRSYLESLKTQTT